MTINAIECKETGPFKVCTACGVSKPTQAFGKQSSTSDGLRTNCRLCRGAYDKRLRNTSPRTRENQRRWARANRHRQRAYRLRSKFNLSEDDYQGLLGEQRGACAICGFPENRSGRRLAVDHDHRCCPGKRSCGRCVRGLLCDACNRIRLPAYESDVWRRAADIYLKRHWIRRTA